MKRIFLVTKLKDIRTYLAENSLTCILYKYKDKNSYAYEFLGYSCVLEEYKKPNKGLNILVVISDKELILNEKIENLQEITDDERYSKEYLSLFGNPKNYEFDIEKVFEKCNNVGLDQMDLNFEMGMSLSKVFRVILYRLSQFYFADTTKAKKLQKAYKLARDVFDKNVIDNLIDSMEIPEIYALNFKAFIKEESFFETDLSKKPVYFFDKKEKLFNLVRR
jgi:hypothetical protein